MPDINQQVDKFHDSHKDLTGPDAGNKITEDFAKATAGMNPQQKRDFCIGLGYADLPGEKVQYDFKDTNGNGIRDSLIVQTQSDAHPWIPGNQLEYKATNITSEVGKLQGQKESMKRPGKGSDLENGVDNVKKRNSYVDGKFDE